MKVTPPTIIAPTQAAIASARQIEGWRSTLTGISGDALRRSCRSSSHSDAADERDQRDDRPARPPARAAAPARAPAAAGPRTRPAARVPSQSNRNPPPDTGRFGSRNASSTAIAPSGRLIRNTDVPAEMLGQPPARHRPERGRHHERAGQIALVARALARRHDLAHQRLRQRHQPAAARPLQHAGRDQRQHGRRERAGQARPDEHAPAPRTAAACAPARRRACP